MAISVAGTTSPSTHREFAGLSFGDHPHRLLPTYAQVVWVGILAVLTLGSRLVFHSKPYYVDGPKHLAAIAVGQICIQPPGYYLFAKTAILLSEALNCSPASAISALNIICSVLGAVVFFLLATRIFPGALGIVLSFCYAFSDTIWFVADIHSSYATMSLLTPSLLYSLWFMEGGLLPGVLWGLMAGFRPSDGMFVVPAVLYVLWRSNPRKLLPFFCAAIPVVLVWYLPTMRHFGGNILAPLGAAGGQASSLANGLLAHAPFLRKVGNLFHLVFGIVDAWGLLTPFLLIGIFKQSPRRRTILLWLVPGFLFFVLYFFSDPVYLTYLIAPGFLLAGAALSVLRVPSRTLVAAAALLFSITQMALLRPIQVTGVKSAIVDAYFLQYSGWALKHRYALRLRYALDRVSPGLH